MAEPAALERQRKAAPSAETTEIAPNLPAGLVKGLRNYWYPVLQSRNAGGKAGRVHGLERAARCLA